MDTEDMLTIHKIYLRKPDNSGFHIVEQDFNSVMNARELTGFYKTRNRLDNIEIDRVVFNCPATIVWFADGTKVVAKCGKDDEWDAEKGLMVCLLKKLVGNRFNNIIEPYLRVTTTDEVLYKKLDALCDGFTLNDDGKVVPE